MVNRVGPCRKIISPCKAQAGCGFVAIAEVGCTCLQGNDRLLGVNNGAGCKEAELNLPPQKFGGKVMVQAERKSHQAFRLRKVESSGKWRILSYGHRPAQNYAQQWAAVDVKKLRSFLAPLFVATKPKR